VISRRVRSLIAASAVIAAFGASISAVSAKPSLIEPKLTFLPGKSSVPEVALTLDACGGKADSRILSGLVENHIPATIFVTAKWLARNPAAVAILKAHPELFEIENHGARHLAAIDRPMRVYGVKAAGSAASVTSEVEDGSKAIIAVTGHVPHWFRGATAKYTPSSLALIGALHERIAGYSIAADGGALLGEKATARRIANARDGDVILAHVNQPKRPAGAGVVEGMLELKAKGFRFVTLSEAMPTGHHGH
jgi:peptidoglycan/xylan/chitin deacetylase (PgdA/CDA1 family)